MKIIIQPAEVDDLPRIAVKNNAYDATFPSRMKQIAGSRWTPDLKCWHIPHTKEAWVALRNLFTELEATLQHPAFEQCRRLHPALYRGIQTPGMAF